MEGGFMPPFFMQIKNNIDWRRVEHEIDGFDHFLGFAANWPDEEPGKDVAVEIGAKILTRKPLYDLKYPRATGKTAALIGLYLWLTENSNSPVCVATSEYTKLSMADRILQKSSSLKVTLPSHFHRDIVSLNDHIFERDGFLCSDELNIESRSRDIEKYLARGWTVVNIRTGRGL